MVCGWCPGASPSPAAPSLPGCPDSLPAVGGPDLRGFMLVDLLIRNARILTQDPSCPVAGSLLVHDGKVLAVDPDPEGNVRAARTIDAGGTTIVPGFNDVHAHSVWFGLGLMEANLGAVKS